MFDRLINLLTDNYKKDRSSNIGKLFIIITEEFDKMRDTLQKIEDYRDVNVASGYTLDKIGANIEQFRGIAEDEIYRVLIKYKLRGVASSGTINEIIEIVSDTLEIDPSEIGIAETYNDEEPEPAAISIAKVPYGALLSIGLSPNQFIQILKSSVPAGVLLKSISLEGTFEFGSTELETDFEKGFADIDMTSGGYFGVLYISGADGELPI